ncbi:MAG TPA: hypothetical protein VKY65_04915 [Alphaproteobacteria bacterium]|nr:hypothetical protein [Alphaproteobacteria bacterium]
MRSETPFYLRHANLPTALRAAALIVALLLAPGFGRAAAPEPLNGFGNIPFGSAADSALRLNNGNGTLTKNGDRTSTLAYSALVAGLDFQVVQNYDAQGRATNARLSYSSLERADNCTARFQYVLNLIVQRYGKPTSIPAPRHEDSGGTSFDRYPYEFALANKTAIRAELEVSYPTPKPEAASGKGPSAAGAGAGATPPPGCRITLDYLPAGWAAHL